jgi:hypothetical protein
MEKLDQILETIESYYSNLHVKDWTSKNILMGLYQQVVAIKHDMGAKHPPDEHPLKRVIEDAYNAGYTDAKINHINDAETYASEILYLMHNKNP